MTSFIPWLLSPFLFISSARASDPYIDEVLVGLQTADPCGDWQVVPLDPKPVSGRGLLLLIAKATDGSTSGKWHNLVLKRGATAESGDGSVELVSIDPDEIDFYDASTSTTGVEPDEIDCAATSDTAEPLAGVEPDEIDLLLRSAPAYVVIQNKKGDGSKVDSPVDMAIVSLDRIAD